MFSGHTSLILFPACSTPTEPGGRRPFPPVGSWRRWPPLLAARWFKGGFEHNPIGFRVPSLPRDTGISFQTRELWGSGPSRQFTRGTLFGLHVVSNRKTPLVIRSAHSSPMTPLLHVGFEVPQQNHSSASCLMMCCSSESLTVTLLLYGAYAQKKTRDFLTATQSPMKATFSLPGTNSNTAFSWGLVSIPIPAWDLSPWNTLEQVRSSRREGLPSLVRLQKVTPFFVFRARCSFSGCFTLDFS